ncbi:hypothetical protein ACE6H2_011941 [Prunus campanulata]
MLISKFPIFGVAIELLVFGKVLLSLFFNPMVKIVKTLNTTHSPNSPSFSFLFYYTMIPSRDLVCGRLMFNSNNI